MQYRWVGLVLEVLLLLGMERKGLIIIVLLLQCRYNKNYESCASVKSTLGNVVCSLIETMSLCRRDVVILNGGEEEQRNFFLKSDDVVDFEMASSKLRAD